ncbi:hypothetical protein SAMN05444166_0070 [Singulisphaera sp. GP187]|nr:hypothetical protein SAMN05444166_0070 [Singulisphaera sp. GP187]
MDPDAARTHHHDMATGFASDPDFVNQTVLSLAKNPSPTVVLNGSEQRFRRVPKPVFSKWLGAVAPRPETVQRGGLVVRFAWCVEIS